MLKEIGIYFLLFFIYSILGWIMEVLNALIIEKKFVNRGFLIGPYCPIYGFGVLMLTLLLRKYEEDIIATFVFSILICGILEYFTSYFLEKIFHARWWDYSNRKYNINGRVCLENLVIFGIFGCFILYIANPFFISVLEKLPDIAITTISSFLVICFLADYFISGNIILNLKEISKNLRKDNTEEISEKVKKLIISKLSLHKRIIKAFPNLKKTIDFEKLIEKGKKDVQKIREKVSARK